jgi:hypothetical protein
MVSKKIEAKILDYIEERRGLATENDVIRYVDEDLSRPPTLKFIDKLESERKINIRRGRKGQRHYLSINDKSRFNQIKKQLSSFEKLIKETNLCLQRCNEEINEEISKEIPLKEIKDNEKAKAMDAKIGFVNDL